MKSNTINNITKLIIKIPKNQKRQENAKYIFLNLTCWLLIKIVYVKKPVLQNTKINAFLYTFTAWSLETRAILFKKKISWDTSNCSTPRKPRGFTAYHAPYRNVL